MKQRELCGSCRHGAHTRGPCQVVVVSGPPSTVPATPDRPHGDRIVTPCDCQTSTPYRNGHTVT